MDSKATIREYNDTPRPMGVYQITNKVNGQALIRASNNLPAIPDCFRVAIKVISYRNKALQDGWIQFGSEAAPDRILVITRKTINGGQHV